MPPTVAYSAHMAIFAFLGLALALLSRRVEAETNRFTFWSMCLTMRHVLPLLLLPIALGLTFVALLCHLLDGCSRHGGSGRFA